MIILATGNGKGKTTAAVGQSIRALGRGRKVFFAQFIKSDSYPSGEDDILRGFTGRIDLLKGGRGFVGIMGDKLPLSEHKAAAADTLARARAALTGGGYGLVVLDEVNVAVGLGLLPESDVLEFLAAAPESCDVMLTGRNASPALMDRADFVTNCLEIKHPFHKKAPARKGLDY